MDFLQCFLSNVRLRWDQEQEMLLESQLKKKVINGSKHRDEMERVLQPELSWLLLAFSIIKATSSMSNSTLYFGTASHKLIPEI